MPTTHATSLTNGEIVEENDLGSIRRVTAGGVTFQSLHECRDRQGGWVLHGQVSVVGVAVELEQRGVEFGAHGAHGVLGEGERVVGEHRPAVLGYEHQMGMQRRHARSRQGGASAAKRLWSPRKTATRCGGGR